MINNNTLLDFKQKSTKTHLQEALAIKNNLIGIRFTYTKNKSSATGENRKQWTEDVCRDSGAGGREGGGMWDRDGNIHGTNFTQKEKGQGGPASLTTSTHSHIWLSKQLEKCNINIDGQSN